MLPSQPRAHYTYLAKFRQTLNDEILPQYLVGRGAFVNGRYGGKRGGVTIYSFTADTELRFPVGGFIKVKYRNLECKG